LGLPALLMSTYKQTNVLLVSQIYMATLHHELRCA